MAARFETPGLEIFRPDEFDDKLRRFGSAGLDSVHAVFDFDLTLTIPDAAGNRVSSWSLLEQHLPPGPRQRCNDLYDTYYPRERDGLLTRVEAESWWNQALALHQEAGTDLVEVERHFMGASSIRPGVDETFDFLNRLDVPSVVLSAGVKNVIDLWCAAYGIRPDLVISTELSTDATGRVTGWDEDTVVHSLNKAENAHPELGRLRAERPNVIVVGDNVNDADMASGDANVIRVRIVDNLADHAFDKPALYQGTAERFDAMIEDGDLFPVRAIANHIDALNDAL